MENNPVAAALREKALNWQPGPSREGGGTAGKDSKGVAQWWDGDDLLVVIEREDCIEIGAVHISADDSSLCVTTLGTGDIFDWEPDAWSWWAKLDRGNLPPIDAALNHPQEG